MGGKASKVLQETTLVKCTAHGDDGSPVICGAPVSESIEGLKGGERCPFVLFGSGTRVQCVVCLAHGRETAPISLLLHRDNPKAATVVTSWATKRSFRSRAME